MNELYIKRCLELAKNGLGTTYPNPLVGSVIVHEGKIIGEGFHQKAGKDHAEVVAIKSVENQELLKNSTIYVNLEPCAHFGKTPPCANLIVEKQIPKVVIGMLDPFSKVNGEGIKRLKNAGIEVEVGILEKECVELNKRFLTFHQKNRPYIYLKFAKSLDGFLNSDLHQENSPFYITNSHSLQFVHFRRTQEQAILIGKNTAIQDNPKLDTRLVGNVSNPLKIIIDSQLETLNHDLQLFKSDAKILIFNHLKDEIIGNIECIKLEKENFLNKLLTVLYKKDIQSIIVEGGLFTLNQFIEQNLWDEAELFTGNKMAISGTLAPNITGKIIEKYAILDDQFLRIKAL